MIGAIFFLASPQGSHFRFKVLATAKLFFADQTGTTPINDISGVAVPSSARGDDPSFAFLSSNARRASLTTGSGSKLLWLSQRR